MRYRSPKQAKGLPMGVSVILDLNEDVSVPQLRQFLSYVPEGFDPNFDLRMQIQDGVTPEFLEIRLPVPPELD
jgi:hypothetical protein